MSQQHTVTHFKYLMTSLFIIVSPVLSASIPSGYYSSVNTSTPQNLHQSLHNIIDDHQRYPYTSSSTDTWNILEVADEDPNDSNKVLDIYKNASYTKAGGGNSYYNREHSWPKSYGFPNDGNNNYPYTDAHHLFISNSSYNTSRSNKAYNNCDSGCIQKSTDYYDNRGGTANQANYTAGSGATGKWETWTGRRGDVARALMYLAVRYEGGTHGITGYSEPDLRLTDNTTLITNSSTGSNLSVAYMGLKSVLLQWHLEDPVDDLERSRNEAVYSYQGNRNPFIDHPEYVECVFNNDCSHLEGSAGNPPVSNNAWINEIHYDNSGTDQGEFVEIAGTQGLSLSGWKILAYNGNDGGVYKTVHLNGTLANQSQGFGAIYFSISGLQNGVSDGIALIDDQENVVQFLSYEGTLTAQNGAANGMTSTNISVTENSSTPQGYSLQLTGSGTEYRDFNWQSPSNDSPGSVNVGQSF